eukprot:jgi/Chlat1/4784/Chrsp31S04775
MAGGGGGGGGALLLASPSLESCCFSISLRVAAALSQPQRRLQWRGHSGLATVGVSRSLKLRQHNPAALISHRLRSQRVLITYAKAEERTAAATAANADLVAFCCEGPLLAKVGLSKADVEREIGTWKSLGSRLCEQLGFDKDALNDAQMRRVYQYYLPVFLWVQKQLWKHRLSYVNGASTAGPNSGPPPPLMVGISAPQGCGKTTLVTQLEELFNSIGCRAVSVSIDDFYLTATEQAKVAETNPGNKLLKYRGNAGSHDLRLGMETLASLRALTSQGATTRLPRYDKSVNGGRGDRAPKEAWPVVTGPVEVVLFEGWMLGFSPIPSAEVVKVNSELMAVNAALGAYENAWDVMVDAWLVVCVKDPEWVYRWRLQAEHQMRAAGKTGMTDDQVADFVSRFMPAYRAYLPGLYKQGPKTSHAERTLKFNIDENRNPIT